MNKCLCVGSVRIVLWASGWKWDRHWIIKGAPQPCQSFYEWISSKSSPPWRDDDKDGHYIFALGENLTSRYKIHRKIGEGTFGRVLECWDRETREMVAIKVVRSTKKYREAAMLEIDVLQLLGKYDRNGSR
ncbi:unnamed protein product [Dovyalis caffra]|uniref:Protein kinase domain-containing protein n=1 Tax=Dovyalis caffra TaxID=77055 RepID=A0AAV1RF97_9ROSI|nr:unnamed protein product [Dovyalis caffra]